ncbi:HAD-IIB family hydrolase [Niabella insulamsoli]|uniref:HAD-IIB family hydrolase n=1 Tax=Niabella insulamsoli TaxID=3144874 RepID=UPI0031FDE39C
MKNYYIQLFSPHGLIRFKNAEIGRDKDTGGQVKYVLELLEALSKHPHVRKVDLFTRRITDKRVSDSYSQPIEIINEKARIVRVDCGGQQYKEKEQLWDYLDEFINNTIRFNEDEDDYPDILHGHYADGNYIACELSKIFALPFIATGHSLGRNKRNILLTQGWDEKKLNDRFNMQRRIDEEEKVIANADVVIVSTQHEIETQYKDYVHQGKAEFKVIPPGINNEVFYPYYRLEMPSFAMTIEQEQALHKINSEIERFLFNADKPLILSIGRADKRKNFEAIINCYGQDKELQAMANLAIFAGVRKDISQMPDDEKEILTNLLLLMDKYDLYGKMALPKKNDPGVEVPEIYRIAARKKGVFVNATPGENFGLTIVEAAACGLPIVASPTGGPKEIVGNAQNGLLVDVEDTEAIAAALKKIISDQNLWEKYSANGIKAGSESYAWNKHAETYMETVEQIFNKKSKGHPAQNSLGRKLADAKMFFISDLDGTLVEGDDTTGLETLMDWVRQTPGVVFGISSGRNKQLLTEALEQYPFVDPDIIICSAGTELYYTKDFVPDTGWEKHINHQWKREAIVNAMESVANISPQEESAQWPFKISYFAGEHFSSDDLANINKQLYDKKLAAKVLFTDSKYIDIIPRRAGKGNVVRYLSYKWKLPVDQFITAGNGGNDIDMLQGQAKGIVVANYSKELDVLKGKRNIFFSKQPLSSGISEGISHYLKSGKTRIKG